MNNPSSQHMAISLFVQALFECVYLDGDTGSGNQLRISLMLSNIMTGSGEKLPAEIHSTTGTHSRFSDEVVLVCLRSHPLLVFLDSPRTLWL